jgi:hypothetical protein
MELVSWWGWYEQSDNFIFTQELNLPAGCYSASCAIAGVSSVGNPVDPFNAFAWIMGYETAAGFVYPGIGGVTPPFLFPTDGVKTIDWSFDNGGGLSVGYIYISGWQ